MKGRLKNLFLVLACVPFLFASCNSSGDDITTTPKLALQGDIVENGTNYIANVSVTCAETGKLDKVTAKYFYNDGKSNKDIESSKITFNKHNDQYWLATITFPQSTGEFTVEKLAVTASTKDGGNTTEEFVLTQTPAETSLTDEAAFTLGRPAHGGLTTAGNGIEWTGNATDGVTANFKAQNIVLSKNTYATINTQEALAKAVEGKSFNATFSAKSDTNFGDTKYYIIKDGNTLRLVQFTDLRFAEGENKAFFTERH